MNIDYDPVRLVYAKRTAENLKRNWHYHAPKRHFIASELGNCKRQMFYRQDGWIPAPRDGRADDYSNDGDEQHNTVRRVLRENGIKLRGLDDTGAETMALTGTVKHKDRLMSISARLDGEIMIRVWHVLEIKSLNTKKYYPFANLWDAKLDPDALYDYTLANHPEFLYQLHACMYLAKRKHGYLLLKDRNNCAIGLHSRKDPAQVIGGVPVRFDPDVWQTALNRMAVVHHALETGIPPKPEYLRSSKQCGWCPYLHLCHEADRRRAAGLQPAMLHPIHGVKLNMAE